MSHLDAGHQPCLTNRHPVDSAAPTRLGQYLHRTLVWGCLTMASACLLWSPTASAQRSEGEASGSQSGDSPRTDVGVEAGVETGVEAQNDTEAEDDANGAAEAPARRGGIRRGVSPDHKRYVHNTVRGTVGGFRVMDAGSGLPGSFRMQLATGFFFADDFLLDGDSNDFVEANLSLSWTVVEHLELFTSVGARSLANDLNDPRVLQVLGDARFGAKTYFNAHPAVTLGLAGYADFRSPVGDVGAAWSSTSGGIDLGLTANLQELDDPLPLVLRFQGGYYFDNSRKLVAGVEEERLAQLGGNAGPFQTDHLVSSVERFALRINRHDFVNVGAGIEVPWRINEKYGLHPIMEWNWGIPVNRQDYTCVFVPESPGSNRPAPGQDGCLKEQGIKAHPMTLTAGLRFLPPVDGLSLFAAVDVGLTGTSTFVRELAPTAPYTVMLGLSFAANPNRGPVATEVRVEEKTKIVTKENRTAIAGRITDEETGAGIGQATVNVKGSEHNPVVTFEDGSFRSPPLQPGSYELAVSHPNYDGTECGTTVAEDEVAEVRCSMKATPKVGTISIEVRDQQGKSLSGATVKATGPDVREGKTNESGTVIARDIRAGEYRIHIEAEGFFSVDELRTLKPDETVQASYQLRIRPSKSQVRLENEKIRILSKILFATGKAQILPQSESLMYEVAETINANPQIRLIEIQGHTDSRGSEDYNEQLSQSRAESVRVWLIGRGVTPTRLLAKGYGESQPLVPNITRNNRAKNRRVEFVILERDPEAPVDPSVPAGE